MKTLPGVLGAMALVIACAGKVSAATIVDFVDGTGRASIGGLLSSPSDLSDWYTFEAEAGTAVVIATLPPQFFDTLLNLYRTPAGPAKAGDLVSTFSLVAFDDDNGPGQLSLLTATLAVT